MQLLTIIMSYFLKLILTQLHNIILNIPKVMSLQILFNRHKLKVKYLKLSIVIFLFRCFRNF